MGVRSLRSSKRQPIEKALGIRFGGEELYVWAFTHRLARLRERRPAHQRAARVPRRRRARPRSADASSTGPSPTCPRPAGQAAGGHGEHERARRGGPRTRRRRRRAPGPGRGAVGRAGQVLDPGRHPRGRARAIYLDKGLSRAAALVRRLFEHRVDGGRRPGAALDYMTCFRSWPPPAPRAGCPPTPSRRRAPTPPAGSHGHLSWESGRHHLQAARRCEEAGRAGGPRGVRVAGPPTAWSSRHRRRRGDRPPPAMPWPPTRPT